MRRTIFLVLALVAIALIALPKSHYYGLLVVISALLLAFVVRAIGRAPTKYCSYPSSSALNKGCGHASDCGHATSPASEDCGHDSFPPPNSDCSNDTHQAPLFEHRGNSDPMSS